MSDKPPVVLYGDEYCAYCAAARMLFTKKGVQFEDVVVSRDPARFDEMQARSGGRRSIPQVFVGDVHVGGFDDLCSLDKSGELDKLLAGDTAGLHSQ
jgi:glutaredoxin 3